MAIVIREIVSEVVLRPPERAETPAAGDERDREELLETVIRRATERVLEILRREWEV